LKSSEEADVHFEYQGQFNNDNFGDGPGELKITQGGTLLDFEFDEPHLFFKGCFKDNKFDGFGLLTQRDKGKYQGHFANGQRSGNGK
jgi:hypothetical protein